jgi:catechol-2,3-dioxygenase
MKLDGSITFFYYDDLVEATKFYEEVLGFKKVIDIPLAKVFMVLGNRHIGLVDRNKEYLKPAADKPVMLS